MLLRRSDSPIYLAHDDVDAADDGGDIGDQAVAADLVGDAQVGEARRARPHAQRHRVLRRSADDVEPHLSARTLRLDIGLAGGQLPRRLDAVRALCARITVQSLADELDTLDYLEHAH